MLTTKNWIALPLCVLGMLGLSACQPSGPRSLLLGDKYVRQGDYTKALKYLNRAAALIPERPQVWNLLGLTFHHLHSPPQAIEAYQRAMRIDRSFAAPYYNLGVLLLEQQRLPEAITELNQYVALQPDQAGGWEKLGVALLRSRKADDAERAFQHALRLNSKDPDALNDLGVAQVHRKRPREAIQAFNAALQARPGYAPALLNQAVVAQEYFGNAPLAIERYRAYLTTKPDAKSAVRVRDVIDALEEKIKPPPELAIKAPEPEIPTNPPPARTNPPVTVAFNKPAAATNHAPAPVPETETNPPPLAAARPPANVTGDTNRETIASAKTNPTNSLANPGAPMAESPRTNAVPAQPKPEPLPPVQVVQVEKEPEFKVPQDIPAPAPKGSPAARSNDLTMAMNTTNAARAQSPAEMEKPLLVPRKEPGEKPGMLERFNPSHWFKHEEAKPPPPGSVRASSSPVPSEPEKKLAYAAPAPPPRIIPRYPYRKNLALAKGNRAQAEKLFAQAASAHQQRRLALAIDLYQKAIQADPSLFDAHYNLGLAAYQAKELPLAISANEEAVALKPESVDARYNFALTLRDAGYYTDAANELRQVVTEAPNEVRAHLALANLYARDLDEPALARRHYQRVLELAPNHPEAAEIRQWIASTQ